MSTLQKIGDDITEELEYQPVELYVKRYVRPQYARPEGDDSAGSPVVVAMLPTRPIEKGIAGPHEGVKRAAIIYSLVATAKLHNLEPFAYLKELLTRLPDHPHHQLAELLPQNWSAQSTKQ